MNAIVKVDFYGDTVLAQQDGENVLVAVKPIVERLGLDWPSQYSRIKRDEILERSIVIITMETPAGSRDTVALPLNLLPGFLFGISTDRVPDPDVRAAVLRYKQECYAVLFRHFFAPKEDTELIDWEGLPEKLMLVKQARLAFGRKSAQELWDRLGLPPVNIENKPASITSDDGLMPYLDEFLDECTEKDSNGMVQAIELYKLYSLWASAQKVPHFTLTMFGILMRKRGIQKRTARHTHYLGLRVPHAVRDDLRRGG